MSLINKLWCRCRFDCFGYDLVVVSSIITGICDTPGFRNSAGPIVLLAEAKEKKRSLSYL